MTSDLRALLESALQPDTPAVSRRPNARQVLEGCWPEIRDAVAPKCAGILRDALGPLAKSNEEPESKAARLALAREEAFQQAFLTALQAELRQAIAQFCAAAGTEREGGQKALTLVGYDEMELATVMESGAARLRNACDEDFTRLKLRLANLVREPDLRDADVPWRPVIFLRAAYLGLERSGIAGPDLLALTKRFDAALAAPAAAAYAALDRHLAGQGISAEVLAASREGAKGPRTGGSRRQAENAGGASRARAGLSAEQLLQALVERLLPLAAAGALKTSGAAAESDLSPTPTAAAAAGAAGGSRFVPAATGGGLTAGQIDAALLHALDEAQRLNALAIAAILQGQTGPAPGAVDAEQLRAQVAEKAARQVDRLTIELVGLLFDRINQDKHVPPAIKNLLHRLQFPLIKVALTDPELFVSPHQPARELLDRIAATSIGWTEQGEHNQRYLAEVQKAVHTV
ncbi:MAG: DUF1631 domain-containing protein, partial [Burkholderiaceae bacterium]|nr:DUF1631 domain-containing protein [Burkholderiaceae bacterium]